MFPRKKFLLAIAGLGCLIVCSAFALKPRDGVNFTWMQECLKSRFNPVSANVKLKRWDLSVTEEGFFRLRKIFPNNKQEYFSFNVKRFSDLSYLGTTDYGDILIKTRGDDIIVQTYNDPKGNIDSMTSVLKLPVVNVEPETLDSLINNLKAAKLK